MKKLMALLLALVLFLAVTPNFSQAKGFSRSSSFFSHSYSSRSYSTPSSSYRTGYRSPSSKVTSGLRNRTAYTNHSYTTTSSSPSLGRTVATHAAAFGAGMLIGHMLHPFGGYYGSYGIHSRFSFSGLLLDVILILIVIWFIKRIFGTRRPY